MSTEYFQRRQSKLRNTLSKENLYGMLVTNLTHIRYLCGFTGSSATLLITAETVNFITDGRYVVQSEKEVKGANIIIDSIPHIEVINNKNLLTNGSKIAFDGNSVSHQAYQQLSKVLSNHQLENITGVIEKMAMSKDLSLIHI